MKTVVITTPDTSIIIESGLFVTTTTTKRTEKIALTDGYKTITETTRELTFRGQVVLSLLIVQLTLLVLSLASFLSH